jgi:hypothetical protein
VVALGPFSSANVRTLNVENAINVQNSVSVRRFMGVSLFDWLVTAGRGRNDYPPVANLLAASRKVKTLDAGEGCVNFRRTMGPLEGEELTGLSASINWKMGWRQGGDGIPLVPSSPVCPGRG